MKRTFLLAMFITSSLINVFGTTTRPISGTLKKSGGLYFCKPNKKSTCGFVILDPTGTGGTAQVVFHGDTGEGNSSGTVVGVSESFLFPGSYTGPYPEGTFRNTDGEMQNNRVTITQGMAEGEEVTFISF